MSRFFVYDLVDPRNDEVFYVGKGTKNRPYEHAKYAKAGVRSRKCNRIREIQAEGLEYRVDIIKTFADEIEAYKYEAERIAHIGLDKLTNVLPGGVCGPLSRDLVDKYDETHLAIMARILRFMAASGGNLFLLGHDITDTFTEALSRCRIQMGNGPFRTAMAAHNITIEYPDGTPD